MIPDMKAERVMEVKDIDLRHRHTGGDLRRSTALARSTRIEMLAAASQGASECPAWVIMEFEAGEKAERERAHGEGWRGS